VRKKKKKKLKEIQGNYVRSFMEKAGSGEWRRRMRK